MAFGARLANAIYFSGTAVLTVVTPPSGQSGAVGLTVTNPSGLSASDPTSYTYVLSTAARVAVRGSDGALWSLAGNDATSPVFNGAWTFLGGGLVGSPQVVSVPNGSATGTPVLIVTGTDHNLWVRSEASGWYTLTATPAYCTGNPGAAVVEQTPGSAAAYLLVVACRGTDGGLWVAQGPVGSNPSVLPAIGAWTSYGGRIVSAPAVVESPPSPALPATSPSSPLAPMAMSGTRPRPWFRTGGRYRGSALGTSPQQP